MRDQIISNVLYVFPYCFPPNFCFKKLLLFIIQVFYMIRWIKFSELSFFSSDECSSRSKYIGAIFKPCCDVNHANFRQMIECYIIERVVTSCIPIQLFKDGNLLFRISINCLGIIFDQLYGYYYYYFIILFIFRVNLFYSSVIGLSRPKDVTFLNKTGNREGFFFIRTMYLQVYR